MLIVGFVHLPVSGSLNGQMRVVGMVSSNMEILDSETSTRSGPAVVVLLSVGMVAGSKSLALRPSKSTKSLLKGGSLHR